MYGYQEIQKLAGVWEGRLIRYAFQFLHDRKKAEEATLAALLDLVRLFPGESGPSDPGPWLLKRVREFCLKKGSGTGNDFQTYPGETPESGMRRAIQSLPGREQELLSLRFEQGLSCGRIAGILDLKKEDVIEMLQAAEENLKNGQI